MLARVPAFWVVFALLALGAGRMAQLAGRFFAPYPVATVTAILLFALLAVPFWIFVQELDFLEREPTELLAVAFGWGALRLRLLDVVPVEETAKTLGVVAIVLIARTEVNSVLDGVVYGALVGLGFQIAEDIVFAVGAVALAGQGDHVQPVIATFLLRGLASGVWSHTLFGALAGAGIGYLVVRQDRRPAQRIGVALLAGLGAWATHVLWNSALLDDGPGNGAPALLGVMLLKGLPPLLLILLLVRHVHDGEAEYYVGLLGTLRDPELITQGELEVLGSGSRRAAARRHAKARGGRRARRAVRRLQRAQARLAVELSRASATVSDGSAGSPCDEIREQRRLLRCLDHPEAIAGPRSWRHTVSTIGTIVVAIAVLWVALSTLGGA